MLIWFWVFCEGEIPGRILITVLILSGLYTTFRKQKAKKVYKSIFPGEISCGTYLMWLQLKLLIRKVQYI